MIPKIQKWLKRYESYQGEIQVSQRETGILLAKVKDDETTNKSTKKYLEN